MISPKNREELADEFRMIANELQTAKDLEDLMHASCWAGSTLTRLDDLIASEVLPGGKLIEGLHA